MATEQLGTPPSASVDLVRVGDLTELVQDIVGATLVDSSEIDFTYNDGAGQVSASMADTGWVNCTTYGGFANQQQPQVRRIGKIVYMRGGWNNTGFSANSNVTPGNVPAGFRPPAATINWIFRPGTSTGAASASAFVQANGNVQIRTNGTLSAYYICCTSWTID